MLKLMGVGNWYLGKGFEKCKEEWDMCECIWNDRRDARLFMFGNGIIEMVMDCF